MKSHRFNLNDSFLSRPIIKTALLTSTLLVTACVTGTDGPKVEDIATVQGFYGAIVSEEPAAALVARDILTAGGTAADAAVAMSFAMSVTYPTRVGLGGNGVCLVHDGAIGLTETLDFTSTPGSLKQGDRPAAVPALVRGMAMLHARYGSLDWRELIIDAEEMARGGYRMSRALNKDLAPYADLTMQDPNIRRLFGTPTGQVLPEGYGLQNIELAALLSQIRAKGAGVLYQGAIAKRIAKSIQAAGGNVSTQDLANYLPTWRGVIGVEHGKYTTYVASPPAGGGSVIAQMVAIALKEQAHEGTDESTKTHHYLEIAKRAYGAQQGYLKSDWSIEGEAAQLLDEDVLSQVRAGYEVDKASTPYAGNVRFYDSPFNTGFVITDRSGNAAACEFSLNNYMGNGRVAQEFGFIVGAAPVSLRRNPTNLSPVMVTGTVKGNFFGALAGSGGSMKKIAMTRRAIEMMEGKESVQASFEETNYGLAWDMKSIVAEENIAPDLVKSLQEKGHRVAGTKLKASVNGIYCPLGLPNQPDSLFCEAAREPDGHGISLITTPK